ncbi:sugar-binding protein [Pseudomonas frederiksbergensis]|uniref:sugar-binding protein n=1 Tax=Pseudomonas frederiksbergensis TaxID=104087 RepID=UPI000FF3B373|nr:sugar-binding protein [Pseudomonas frederiksbergensis]RON50811.1 hypothetical protein BK667_18430 [Pseudomonas frederiksbergensis]
MSQPVFVNLACVPSPEVTQAPDNPISVRRVDVGQSEITVHVRPWPFMAPSNTVTLHVCGQRNDGSPFMLRVAYAERVTDADLDEGWQCSISWNGIEDLLHGSSLVFVFQVAFDDCCGCCPLLLPPVSLQVNVPWRDLTTFTDGDYNGWQAGPAAADPQDLSIIKLPDGNEVLFNNTYTSNSNGVVLFKTYSELRVGEVYEFSMRTRRSTVVGTRPILALRAGDTVVAGPEEIPGADWMILRGSFTASAATMTFNIVSEVATGSGNDYYVDDILLRTL